MRKILNFIFYNNTIPILLGVLFLGAGVTLAANEDARELLISSEEVITSIDNTYIRKVNLDTFAFEIETTSVTEDDTHYYVGYTFKTIDLEDGVWQKVTKIGEVAVSKIALGDNDLGLFVTEELKEIRDAEIERLKETQEIELAIGESPKVVATVYKGLVGKMLDPKEEVLEGYDPVIEPPKPGPIEEPVSAVAEETEVQEPEIIVSDDVHEVDEARRSGGSNEVDVSDNASDQVDTEAAVSATTTTPTTTPPQTTDEHSEQATSTENTATTTDSVDGINSPEGEVGSTTPETTEPDTTEPETLTEAIVTTEPEVDPTNLASSTNSQ